MKRILLFFALLSVAAGLSAAPKAFTLKSPDGRMKVEISTDGGIRYSLTHDDVLLLENSGLSMSLTDGTVYGGPESKLRRARIGSANRTVKAVAYKKAEVRENYNELTLEYRGFKVIFRAYDDACAYRFVSLSDKPFIVKDEQADFRFPEDRTAYIPYIHKKWKGSLEEILENDFQCPYTHSLLSEWNERYSIAPLLVECPEGKKVVITEADLMNYPGMFLYNYKKGSGETLSGYFARVPDKTEIGGHNMVQEKIDSRKDYIAECQPFEKFPWRVVAVSSSDKELTDSDIVWKLATPAADTDWSWVRPGKVAWDWWNAWNIKGVDFEAGVNNDTYKYYIDFAQKHGIEYVILDEGWAVNKKADLMQIIPEIDLPMLCEYAKAHNVGLILWAGYYAFDRDMENVCKHYSEMGIKGFKVDFMDRDDQYMVDFFRRAAETAAKYGLLIDFHGAFKPVGLNRTYPNVINYEGVFGLEQMKWSKSDVDQVTYDVTVPFIRMAAGPMDYTQGAMRNAIQKNYHPVNSEAMSQGTRCHQLAEYVVFDSPLNMLCDSPSNYMAEPECTKYIADCPTVWDESVAVNGVLGRFITLARRSGDVWYVGSLNDWKARDLTLDLGFLGEGDWTMEIFRDGINADRAARDYKRELVSVPADRKVKIHMAPGGGWTARITKK